MELTQQLRNYFRKCTAYEPIMLFCEQCKSLLPVTLQGISLIHDELEMELSSTINEILYFLLISHYDECVKKALCDIRVYQLSENQRETMTNLKNVLDSSILNIMVTILT